MHHAGPQNTIPTPGGHAKSSPLSTQVPGATSARFSLEHGCNLALLSSQDPAASARWGCLLSQQAGPAACSCSCLQLVLVLLEQHLLLKHLTSNRPAKLQGNVWPAGQQCNSSNSNTERMSNQRSNRAQATSNAGQMCRCESPLLKVQPPKAHTECPPVAPKTAVHCMPACTPRPCTPKTCPCADLKKYVLGCMHVMISAHLAMNASPLRCTSEAMASMMMGYLQEVADRAMAERTRKGQNSWHMQMDRWLEGSMR